MEKVGYFLLGIVFIIWLVGIIIGMIVAIPWGIIGLIAIIGIGFLFMQVISDRLSNKEDDYYDKHVKQ